MAGYYIITTSIRDDLSVLFDKESCNTPAPKSDAETSVKDSKVNRRNSMYIVFRREFVS